MEDYGWVPARDDRMRCGYPDCPSQFSTAAGQGAAGPHLHKGLAKLVVTELRLEKRSDNEEQGMVTMSVGGHTRASEPFLLLGSVDKEPHFFLLEGVKSTVRVELHSLGDDGVKVPLGEVSVNVKDHAQQKGNGRWYPMKKHADGDTKGFNSKRTIKVAIDWTPPGPAVADWARSSPGAIPLAEEPEEERSPKRRGLRERKKREPEMVMKVDDDWCCDYVLVVCNPHKLTGMGDKKKNVFGQAQAEDGIPVPDGPPEDEAMEDPDEGTPLTAEDEKQREREEIMHQAIKHVALVQRNLKNAGISYRAYLSLDSRSIVMELSAPEDALVRFAKHIGFPLMMKEEWAGGPVEMNRYFRMKEEIGSEDYNEIAPNSDTLEVSLRSNKHASIHDDRFKLFSSSLRVRLIHEAISMPGNKGGASINILKLSHSDKEALRPRIIKDMFPAHQRSSLYHLDSSWVFAIFKTQPLDKIKNYYGSEIALYFAFVGYFVTWLSFLGVIGVPISIYQLATRQADNAALSSMTIVICILMSVYLGMWKRREKQLAHRWGSHGLGREEVIRKEFKPDGETKIAGKSIPTYSHWKQQLRVLLNWPFVLGINLLGVAVTVLLLIVHHLLLRYSAVAAGVVVGFGIAFVVVIFNQLFNYLAYWMTRFENHRTEREFRNSYTIKVFIFYFVICYTPLMYIAFIKPFVPNSCHPAYDGGPPDCMNELAVVLFWVFLFRLLLRFFLHTFFPVLFLRIQVWRLHYAVTMKPGRKEFSFAEAQRLRASHTGLVDNYMEIVVQFGYLCFFGVAFPIIFLLAAIVEFIEMRWQAYRMVHMIKRPFPQSAESIGIYFTLMEVIAFVGIVCNCLIFAVTSTMLSKYTLSSRLWILFSVEHALLLLKVAISYLFSRTPWKTEKKLRDQIQILDAPGGFSRKIVYEDSDEDAPLRSPTHSDSGASSIGPSPSERAYQIQKQQEQR